MMLIGRHRNVVHSLRFLEHIQETKSTTFLILELVSWRTSWTWISSNAAKIPATQILLFTESKCSRKFSENSSGIHKMPFQFYRPSRSQARELARAQ
jgi:hypothetical protein